MTAFDRGKPSKNFGDDNNSSSIPRIARPSQFTNNGCLGAVIDDGDFLKSNIPVQICSLAG